MKLDDIRDFQTVGWHPLSAEEVAALARFWDADKEDAELLKAIELEAQLADEISRATTGAPAIAADELVYVALGNATTKDDYLRLMARYGTPANRDLDHNALLAYEALGEALYRTAVLLAFSENLGELDDIAAVFHVESQDPHLSIDCPVSACMNLSIAIPDYRRVIFPNEVRVEDVNDAYWPPMFNQAAGYAWSTADGKWATNGVTRLDGRPPGLILYQMRVFANDEGSPARFSSEELRFFAGALANSVINEQLKDMRLSFRGGEVDLVDPNGAMAPPLWRIVWIALAQAKGKWVPGICRTCGRLVDRRAERRNKKVSCTDGLHKCSAAFHNNGGRRMVKRSEWGREFKDDATFAYIQSYRDAVLEMLLDQKYDPDWPPYASKGRRARAAGGAGAQVSARTSG